MAEHGRPVRRRSGCTGLQAPGAPETVERREAYPVPDLRCGSGERPVIVQIDPEYARRLDRSKPGRVEHSERDRHLSEDVTGDSLADHALHAVGPPQHFDATRKNAEQGPLITLVHGELTRSERDVRYHPGKPFAFGLREIREHRDLADLLRRHHKRVTATR